MSLEFVSKEEREETLLIFQCQDLVSHLIKMGVLLSDVVTVSLSNCISSFFEN